MLAAKVAHVCSVCDVTFMSRSASPRHRCKGDHAGRFGVPVRDATPFVDTGPPPVTQRNAAPEPIEGNVEFLVSDDDDDDPPMPAALGVSDDYVEPEEPKQYDRPTSRTTVVKLSTYIAALEHGLGMTTLSPAELKKVKADLAGNAADIHIETAEIVIGAGASILLSGGLLALIYGRDLMGADMGAILSMLKPSAPPAKPRDEWAEGGD